MIHQVLLPSGLAVGSERIRKEIEKMGKEDEEVEVENGDED
jgi:hypothetical protein